MALEVSIGNYVFRDVEADSFDICRRHDGAGLVNLSVHNIRSKGSKEQRIKGIRIKGSKSERSEDPAMQRSHKAGGHRENQNCVSACEYGIKGKREQRSKGSKSEHRA